MEQITKQMNEFRRLENGNIALNGVIWSHNADKAIELTNSDNGFKVHSIKLDDIYYYPIKDDKQKSK